MKKSFFLFLASFCTVLYAYGQVKPSKPNNRPNQTVLIKPGIRFGWILPERYENSWKSWNELKNTYDDAYINPKNWNLRLTACASRIPNDEILSYEWNMKGLNGTDFFHHYTTTECASNVKHPDFVPGNYEITLTLKLKSGTSKTIKENADIKDYLIVSIGDSFSSGEGNPDVEGKYTLADLMKDACQGKVDEKIKKEDWECRRCHRSKWSAPALTAQQIEESDRHSSVTFLSFACSGARTEHLIDTEYRGIEFTMPGTPNDEPPLPDHIKPKRVVPPQLESVKDAVGNRVIDVLFISIGINDLKFSEVIRDCGSPSAMSLANDLSQIKLVDGIATFTIGGLAFGYNMMVHPLSFKENIRKLGTPSCVSRQLFSRLDKLYGSYDRLAKEIKRTLKVKEVYFIEYPTNIFQKTDGSPFVCECLDFGGNAVSRADFGITDAEANWLGAMGTTLNMVSAAACQRNDWNNVIGVFERFQGKGYCESGSTRYFRRIRESVGMQGKYHGGLHPNKIGHEVVRDLLDKAIKLEYTKKPIKRVTVTFTRARTNLPEVHDFTIPAKLDLQIRLKPPPPFSDFSSKKWPLLARNVIDISQFPNRQWFSLNENSSTFNFDIYESPQPLRNPTEFDIVASVAGVQVVEENIVSKLPLAGNLSVPQSKTFSLKGNNAFTGLECTVRIQRISNQ